jgi:LacI family transcriptional regulator
MGINCDMVLVDNLNASYSATEHLITRGHRNIGIICGQGEIYTAQERLKGYKRVYEDYGMTVNEEYIKYGNYQLESGYRLMKEFLHMKKEKRPSAVFITNYEMTLGAFIAINENNIKVPEEMSIIGFDNLTMSRIIKPALSVVIQPMQQIGETVANLMLKRLKGDMSNFPSMFRLKTELLQQESVSDHEDK